MGAFRIRWPGEGREERKTDDGGGVGPGGGGEGGAPAAGSLDAGASVSTVETPALSLDDGSVEEGGEAAAESSTAGEAPVKADVAAWDTPAALVKRYFHQLTTGCGRKHCPNRNCRNCPDGHGALDPTAAAVLSLQLAQGQTHHLCDDGPPFLHLELVRGDPSLEFI